jgi:phospholipid/cholesterol/gamma-HCH transport system permease protein
MQVQLERDGTQATVHFRGELTSAHAAAVFHTIEELAREREIAELRVNLAAVGRLDTPAAAALLEGIEIWGRSRRRAALSRLRGQHRSALDLVRVPRVEPSPERETVPARLRPRVLRPAVVLAELVVDTWTVWLKIPFGRERLRLSATADQAVRLGVDALPIVALLSFLTGLILAFQGAFQLRKFGAEPLVAEIVSLGMVREFGALMTAIILSGRSGAAITAELGTMAVREELDALRTMGISPVSFLVVPRILALMLVQPLLTLWAIAIGIGGGLLTTNVIGLPMAAMYARMSESLGLGDFALALGKSLLFSAIIAFTGCHLGLRTRGGARSVGESTTRCVVISILLIVIVDSVVTTLWTNAGHGT